MMTEPSSTQRSTEVSTSGPSSSSVYLPKTPPKKIKIISANARGLNNPERRGIFFSEQLALSPELVLVQETKIKNENISQLLNLWKGPSFWSSTESSYRGVAILFTKNHSTNPNLIYTSSDGRICIVSIKWNDTDIIVINIYAPNLESERYTFFSDLNSLVCSLPHQNIILAGDFNCVIDCSLDKIGGSETASHSIESLIHCLENHNLIDCYRITNPDKKEFTWCNSLTGTRIDRIYISAHLSHLISECDHLPNSVSDHKSAFITLSPPPSNHKICAKKLVTTNKYCYMEKEVVNKIINSNPVNTSDLILIINKEAGTFQKTISNQQNDLFQKIIECKEKIKNIRDNTELLTRTSEEKSLLYKMINSHNKHMRSDFEKKLKREGEKCSKFITKLANTTSSQTINALRNEFNIPDNSIDSMLNTATSFYKELYSKSTTEQEGKDAILKAIPTIIGDELNDELTTPISVDEVITAIMQSPSDKAPGPDCIPPDLWSHLITHVPIITQDFNYWLGEGSIPSELNSGIITLLYKKEDPTKIQNYRPISLLNTLKKVLSKVIANRLLKASFCISSEQTGIPGRYIGTNIVLTQSLIDHSNASKEPLGLLLMDQEKAFDRIEHEFILDTLLSFGFHNKFVNWIKTTLKDSQSRIKINGFLGEPFPLERGVRQGDPLSPLLFVFAMEPLIRSLKNDHKIKGYLVENQAHKISAFADDLTTFISCTKDWKRVEKWMAIFEKASGAKFNNKKCEYLTNTNTNINPPSPSYFPPTPSESTRYLGIEISFKTNINRAWEGPLSKFERCIEMWSKIPLSLTSKIVVIKSYCLPILTYHAGFLAHDDSIVDEIKKKIRKLLWSGKRAKVSYEKCTLPKSCGGLNAPSIEATLTAPKIRWVFRLIENIKQSWSQPSVELIKCTNYEYGHGLSSLFLANNKSRSNAIPSSFWKQAIKEFWKLKSPIQLNFQLPSTANAIRCMPLFNNPLIMHKGRPITGKFYQDLAKKGLVRIADIIFANRIGTAQQIKEYFNINVSNHTLDLIKKAIPTQWLDCIQDHPWSPSSDGNWATLNKDGSINIVNHIDPDSMLYYRPYKQGIGFLDTLELPFSITIPNASIRRLITNHPPHSTSTELKKMWKSNVPAKFKDISWLIHHNAIWTGQKSQKTNHPFSCFCGSPETSEHLFLRCPHAQQVWNLATDEWTSRTSLNPPNINKELLSTQGWLPHNISNKHKSLWQRLHLTALYSIWTGRCHNVYEGPPSDSVGRWIVNTRRVACLQASLRGIH